MTNSRVLDINNMVWRLKILEAEGEESNVKLKESYRVPIVWSSSML